jgi:predicted CoA-binding protein
VAVDRSALPGRTAAPGLLRRTAPRNDEHYPARDTVVDLQSLLEPKSVAIVGASAEPKKLSGMILGFLKQSGYAGRVYAVNPRYRKIGELLCFPSIDPLPETVD